MNLPDEWSAGRVVANGIDLQYYRTGSGPPVVMAHGMYGNGRRWLPVGSDLAVDHEVVAYDARGHGRSDAPETGYGIDDRVADLIGLVDALDLSDPALVGHSMGAATAAWAAAEHPSLPRGLVLEDPARFHETVEMSFEEAREAASEHLATSQEQPVEERIEEHFDDVDVAPEHVRRLATAVDECSPHVVNYAQEHDLVVEAFDEIRCPYLVLRRDREVADRVADLAAADRLADGRLVHVPGTGHHVFRDAYDPALAELRTFLRRVE